MRKHIPNLLTITNLICGCIALQQVFEGNLTTAAYLIGLSALFDFMDGAAARLLKVSNALGKELDSLADLVSFGVVPGAVVFQLLESSSLGTYSFIALIIPALSAYRLAKFNIDERQTDMFIGLPVPANALVFLSFPLIAQFQPNHILTDWIATPEVLVIASIVFSICLITELPLFALKFKSLAFTDNKLRYLFMILAVTIIVFMQFAAIPVVVILYILLSLIFRKTTFAK